MSSLEAGNEAGSGDSERLTIESETEGVAASSETDTFSEIDIRLGRLLDRANKLETTLDKLNCKCINEVQGIDLDLPKVEGEHESFEDAIGPPDIDSLNLSSSANSEIDVQTRDDGEIYLDIQED